MLERNRSLVGVDDVTWLMLDPANPLCKLPRIGNCGREEHQAHGVWQQNHHLLPDDAPVTVLHVVHLVKDHPCHLPRHIRAPVQHGPQDFCGHDHAGRMWVDGHITCHQAYILELVLKVPVLLVTQGLNGRGVDDPLLVSKSHGDGILCDHRLSGRGVRSHHDRLPALQTSHSRLLERIQLEGIRLGRSRRHRRGRLPSTFCWSDTLVCAISLARTYLHIVNLQDRLGRDIYRLYLRSLCLTTSGELLLRLLGRWSPTGR
mmetsp:Transcript_50732/g.82345  ORF Transcript_50732/g.82345 Transcript_50732/m.82345 type:complete len:260 (+) Transcript_50732:216-995(+)